LRLGRGWRCGTHSSGTREATRDSGRGFASPLEVRPGGNARGGTGDEANDRSWAPLPFGNGLPWSAPSRARSPRVYQRERASAESTCPYCAILSSWSSPSGPIPKASDCRRTLARGREANLIRGARMCGVCKSDEKCEHPWSQCMASRGAHCAICGQESWTPRRPSHAPPTPGPPAR